ncbi:alpha/beta hydrolase fold-3 domain-containing protein [Apiospora marii]|uniref:alpha/beta hydrolase fold-3 domain-containing protein n=1 Tax=Apiospora marii TaxID=335849 RepID=UPI0031327062
MASDSHQQRLEFLRGHAEGQRDPELDELLSSNGPWPDPPFTDKAQCRSLSDYADGLLIKALGPCPAGLHEEVCEIPTSDSYISTALLTRPAPSSHHSPGPLIVLFHPGGFFLGSPAKLSMYARPLAKFFGASVLCPSYRFARRAAEKTGLRPPLTGVWAPLFMGLNEAAAVPEAYRSLWASHGQHGRDALVIDGAKAATMWDYYRPGVGSPLFNPLASPLEGLVGMPRVFLQVAGHDMFRDDGLVLAYALRDRGGEVRLEVYPGVCHSFWVFAPGLTVSKRFFRDIVVGFAWLLGVGVEDLGPEWETAMAMPDIKVAHNDGCEA